MDDRGILTQLARVRFAESLRETEPYEVAVLGKDFVVLPRVFSPKYFVDTDFFARHLDVVAGERFLEVGCGTGVLSVFAALSGALVTAVDITDEAVENTKKNVARYGLETSVSVLKSDLFESISDERFDTIFWNTPFSRVEEDVAAVELAIVDPYDASKERFVEGAAAHLSPTGRLMIGFSSNYGDLAMLERLLAENGYEGRIVAQESKEFNSGSMNLELIEAKLLSR